MKNKEMEIIKEIVNAVNNYETLKTTKISIDNHDAEIEKMKRFDMHYRIDIDECSNLGFNAITKANAYSFYCIKKQDGSMVIEVDVYHDLDPSSIYTKWLVNGDKITKIV